MRGFAGAGAHRQSSPKPAAANLDRRAGARAARSRWSVTWRQSSVTVTTGNAFAERFAGIGEGWRVRRRQKRAGRAESGAPRATAAENTARGLSRLATDPAEGASSGGADPTCAHRERHPRFRTLTQRSVLTDAQTDWAGKWARRGTCMALESTLVPFVWPRTAAGCDQGPPSVEPRWRRCSVQIQIRSDSPIGMSIRTLFTCHVHTNQRVGTNFLR